MLGSIKGAVQSSGATGFISGTDLDFSTTTFGKAHFGFAPNEDVDGDGNHGHGDSDGCDPSNPSNKCHEKKDKTDKTGDDPDGDGDNGHGNNEDKCDPSNPNYDKKGCEGGDDTSGGDGDGDDTSGGDGDGDDSSGGDGDGDGDGGSGTSGSGGTKLCGSAIPVPTSIELVAGKAYQSSPDSWASGSEETGWRCLRVGRNGAQSYQYGYDVGAGTMEDSTESYTAWARGDLDADGRTSLFRIRGEVVGGQVIHGPAIEMIDQTE
jgi:type IV pilus assembly protein PilA